MHYIAIENDRDVGDRINGIFKTPQDAMQSIYTSRVEVWNGKVHYGTYTRKNHGAWDYNPE